MRRLRKHKVAPFSSDQQFPYVLVESTFGAIVSLGAVWFAVALV